MVRVQETNSRPVCSEDHSEQKRSRERRELIAEQNPCTTIEAPQNAYSDGGNEACFTTAMKSDDDDSDDNGTAFSVKKFRINKGSRSMEYLNKGLQYVSRLYV